MKKRLNCTGDPESFCRQEGEYAHLDALIDKFLHVRGDRGASEAEKDQIYNWGVESVIRNTLLEMVMDGVANIDLTDDEEVVFCLNDTVSTDQPPAGI